MIKHFSEKFWKLGGESKFIADMFLVEPPFQDYK